MEPVINIQDQPGKTVGRRTAPRDPFAGALSASDVQAWRSAMKGTRFVPRGVYRFESHEAADAWLWKMMTRP